MCGFDSAYDSDKGMEDFAFFVEAALMGFKIVCLPIQMQVRVGIHHDQQKKEAGELAMMRRISQRLLNEYGDIDPVREAILRFGGTVS